MVGEGEGEGEGEGVGDGEGEGEGDGDLLSDTLRPALRYPQLRLGFRRLGGEGLRGLRV